MENQHRKIAGYRELSQEEIDLMNRIKAKGAELLQLQAELAGRLSTDLEVKQADARRSMAGKEYNGVQYNEHTGASDECIEFRRFHAAEPLRWAAIGKTDIQTGLMALVRAVAQPAGV
ncbi:Acb2/Tad1 domain-containing protein [Pseudomonas sp. SP16.1]|uniref:Acb2/Tad1 domain-containing protein n=1 Tax=Pseudomonas sp. SP16.1 TaxID=3458854 RepID=UPI0040464E88